MPSVLCIWILVVPFAATQDNLDAVQIKLETSVKAVVAATNAKAEAVLMTNLSDAKVALRGRMGFNSHEHMDAGDIAMDKFLQAASITDTNVRALLATFQKTDDSAYIDNRDPLHFGDLVALGGDYYNDENRTGPGSVGVQLDMKRWGLGQYDEVANNFKTARDVKSLYEELDYDIETQQLSQLEGPWALIKDLRSHALNQGDSEPSAIYQQYSVGFAGWALVNHDHFGGWAKDSFMKMHGDARSLAFSAGTLKRSGVDPNCAHTTLGSCHTGICYPYRKSSSCVSASCVCGNTMYGKKTCSVGEQCRPNPRAWPAELRRAFEVEAFGMHYYSDLFSSGHMRTPRSGSAEQGNHNLEEWCGEGVRTSFLSHAQHNEDGTLGLEVNNALGQTWKAYGDGHWFNAASGPMNKNMALDGMVAALKDVYAAFEDGAAGRPQGDSAAGAGGTADPLAWLPTYESAQSSANHPPMFRSFGDVMQYRLSPPTEKPGRYRVLNGDADFSRLGKTIEYTADYGPVNGYVVEAGCLGGEQDRRSRATGGFTTTTPAPLQAYAVTGLGQNCPGGTQSTIRSESTCRAACNEKGYAWGYAGSWSEYQQGCYGKKKRGTNNCWYNSRQNGNVHRSYFSVCAALP